jgi:hypothetical protein
MAEYTITIKDEDGAISILLAGDGQAHTAASFTAQALMRKVPDVVPGAIRAADRVDATDIRQSPIPTADHQEHRRAVLQCRWHQP